MKLNAINIKQLGDLKGLPGLLGFYCQALEIKQETSVCWELDAVMGLDAEA